MNALPSKKFFVSLSTLLIGAGLACSDPALAEEMVVLQSAVCFAGYTLVVTDYQEIPDGYQNGGYFFTGDIDVAMTGRWDGHNASKGTLQDVYLAPELAFQEYAAGTRLQVLGSCTTANGWYLMPALIE